MEQINLIGLFEKGVEGKFIKTPSLTDKQAQRSFHIDRSLGKILN